MLKLHILASGSRGNATIVENDQTGRGVLIDCGICKRDFLARCDEARFNPANIDAVLITHDHGDHTKGLGVVMRGLAKMGRQPLVYAADETVRASKAVQDATSACGTRNFHRGMPDGCGHEHSPLRPRTTRRHRSASVSRQAAIRQAL
ncbi:MAG: MBL fold metallo-hydrolase [Slackia sp.]